MKQVQLHAAQLVQTRMLACDSKQCGQYTVRLFYPQETTGRWGLNTDALQGLHSSIKTERQEKMTLTKVQ